MTSYMSVEEHYGSHIKCEVENCDVSERRDDEIILDCYTAYVDFELFRKKGFIPISGDIFSVKHENGEVNEICNIEPAEKQRRIKLLMGLISE